MVLAWDAAKHGAADPSDGENVIIHEFAHQLDFENHETDGTPALRTRAEYLAWGRVMSREFKALRNATEAGRPTVLDTYGATDPAEFFAVATEVFFERPRALRTKHPKLYGELVQFFRQDPLRYSDESIGTARSSQKS
jgi:Mlc titration factor MtfA (ptsG expression regulator)